MYRYYIFDIKNKFKNDNNLYRLLKTLYTLNLKYINYGELIYNEMCKPINRENIKEILKDYNAKKVSRKYFICLNDEITIVVIKYSRLIIISNKLYPDIFNRLKIECENLFVCNFLNDNYFYVSKCCKNM
ncbi:unknown [Firmicutes bacterium CAG:884]|nr:sporulation inhibitor of replication protein SirA [Bacillota bacterium]CCY94310.1 unknown [Firmicutes bacterium CAG:884]